MPRQHQDSLLDAARQGDVWVLLTPSCNVPFGAADVFLDCYVVIIIIAQQIFFSSLH